MGTYIIFWVMHFYLFLPFSVFRLQSLIHLHLKQLLIGRNSFHISFCVWLPSFLSAPLWSERSANHTNSHIWRTFPFALIGSHKLCASYTRNIHTAACHVTWWRWLWWKVAAAVLRTKIDWKLIKVLCHLSLFLEAANLQ